MTDGGESPARSAAPEQISVNLALQGGGSHGAFTWGVLDALLQDGRLAFDGVTGASAGAMNAVAMADGWRKGAAAGVDPRQRSRESLQDFWRAVGRQPNALSFGRLGNPFAVPGPAANPLLSWVDVFARLWSPYQLNPFGFNPLRRVLADRIDFDSLVREPPFKLFVCATNVRTGRARVFREHELSVDTLLASACLPFAFQAVEVAGEAYWDGGYMGNPALFPLFYATTTCDLLLVQINPMRRDDVPDTAQEIADRASEISFNASLVHELRSIAFVQRLLDEQRVDPARYRRVRLHVIDGGEGLARYPARTKYVTDPAFLAELHELGRRAAGAWLDDKLVYVGHAGTTRIADHYL